ncbi:MAG: hypothetical protein HY898_23285 [Deltaproteobacteria bacterium]|nr:hypothetical protein [Deltaproteobacteria bacterium]
MERFYPSAPGGGWMVMDDLDLRGSLGGVIALSGGYARNPLRLAGPDAARRVDVISDQAFADVGVAMTYSRFRLYLNLASPLAVRGKSGTIGEAHLTAPSVSLGENPDTFSDVRLGFDARLLGDTRGPLRLGVGAQLIVPSAEREDYLTDGTWRAMGRVLFAGNLGLWTYAGQMGLHLRKLDDTSVPESPQGHELLFGIAAGPRFPSGPGERTVVVIGPELFGQTAARSMFGTSTTGAEALLTGRVEHTADDRSQVRFKLGTGGGLHPHFGAPVWRAVVAIEVSHCP